MPVVDTGLIQPCSESMPECVPAELGAVDMLRNLPPREIVQIERSQEFLTSKHPTILSCGKVIFIFRQNLS